MGLVGAKVRIISDNENYVKFLGVDLIITSASNKDYFYDDSLYPEKLCNLMTIDGKDIPFSLYEYEFEIVKN